MPSQEAGSNSSGPGSSSGSGSVSGPGSGSTDRQAQDAQGPGATSPPRTEQELAQAFKDLARGENAATALENNLTTLEGKIDELLASFERSAGAFPPAGSANGNGTSDAPGGGDSQNVSKK